MKKIIIALVALISASAFSKERTIEYSVTGYGKAPDFVRVNYKEEPIDHESCRIIESEKYFCTGTLTLNLPRLKNSFEVRSQGIKTLDIEAIAFSKCNSGYVEITPPNGLYAKRLSGRNGLYLNGEIDLGACY